MFNPFMYVHTWSNHYRHEMSNTVQSLNSYSLESNMYKYLSIYISKRYCLVSNNMFLCVSHMTGHAGFERVNPQWMPA